MAIQDKDAESQLGDVLETYHFNNALTDYYYTSHSEDVTIDGNTYQAVPIQRSSFDKGIIDGVSRCTIKAPITTIFYQYVASYPTQPTTVQIKRYYMDDYTESVLVFNGVINSITINKHIAEAECLSNYNELKHSVPGIYIQPYCNNVLYGPICKAKKVPWVRSVIVDEDDQSHLIVHDHVDVGDDYFTLGTLEFNEEKRLITKQTCIDADHINVYLHFPIRDLETGLPVTLYRGCDKTARTCHYDFNNLENFVGMYYIPEGPNPVQWGFET